MQFSEFLVECFILMKRYFDQSIISTKKVA